MFKKLLSALRKKNSGQNAVVSTASPQHKDSEEHIVSVDIPSSLSDDDLKVPSPSGKIVSSHHPDFDAPSPSSPFLDDEPLPVELVRLPGEDPFEELLYSLKAAYNLIKAGRFDQAGMLYDIIDPAFKKYSSSFPKSLRQELKRYYDEVTLYLWVHDAYDLALKRRLVQLKSLVGLINSLASSVLASKPIDINIFNRNMKKLESALKIANLEEKK